MANQKIQNFIEEEEDSISKDNTSNKGQNSRKQYSKRPKDLDISQPGSNKTLTNPDYVTLGQVMNQNNGDQDESPEQPS